MSGACCGMRSKSSSTGAGGPLAPRDHRHKRLLDPHGPRHPQETKRKVTIQWDDGKKPGTAALDALDAYGYGDNGAASQEVSRASLGSPPSELMHSANYDELLDDLTADATTMAPRAQQEDTDIDDLSPIVAYNEEMTQQTMSSYSNENKSSSNQEKYARWSSPNSYKGSSSINTRSEYTERPKSLPRDISQTQTKTSVNDKTIRIYKTMQGVESSRIEAENRMTQSQKIEQQEMARSSRIEAENRMTQSQKIEQEEMARRRACLERERREEEKRQMDDEKRRLEDEAIRRKSRIEEERLLLERRRLEEERRRVEEESVIRQARLEMERKHEEERLLKEKMRVEEERRRIEEESAKRKEKIEKERKMEEARLFEEKKRVEQERKRVEKEKRRIEEERRKQEILRKQQEEERLRLEIERKREEEERLRLEKERIREEEEKRKLQMEEEELRRLQIEREKQEERRRVEMQRRKQKEEKERREREAREMEQRRIFEEREKQRVIQEKRLREEKEKLRQESIKIREEEERLRLERERQESEEIERVQREKLERERLDKERRELERLEIERAQKAKREMERLENERREREKFEKERRERERLEGERLEKERREREIMERKRLERERLQREKLEMEGLEKERRERERLEREHLEKERQERERIEKERLELERMERLRQEEEARMLQERMRLEKQKLRDEEGRMRAEAARLEESEQEHELKKIITSQLKEEHTVTERSSRKGLHIESKESSSNQQYQQQQQQQNLRWSYPPATKYRKYSSSPNSRNYDQWVEIVSMTPEKYQQFHKVMPEIPTLSDVEYDLNGEAMNSKKPYREKKERTTRRSVSRQDSKDAEFTENLRAALMNSDSVDYNMRDGKSNGHVTETTEVKRSYSAKPAAYGGKYATESKITSRRTNQTRHSMQSDDAAPTKPARTFSYGKRTRSSSLERRIHAYEDSVEATKHFEKKEEGGVVDEEEMTPKPRKDAAPNIVTRMRTESESSERTLRFDDSMDGGGSSHKSRIDYSFNSSMEVPTAPPPPPVTTKSYSQVSTSTAMPSAPKKRGHILMKPACHSFLEMSSTKQKTATQTSVGRSASNRRPRSLNQSMVSSQPDDDEVDHVIDGEDDEEEIEVEVAPQAPASTLVAKYEALTLDAELDSSFRGSEMSEPPYQTYSYRHEMAMRGLGPRPYNHGAAVRKESMLRTENFAKTQSALRSRIQSGHEEKTDASSFVGISKFSDTSSVISAAELAEVSSDISPYKPRGISKRQQSTSMNSFRQQRSKAVNVKRRTDDMESMSQYSESREEVSPDRRSEFSSHQMTSKEVRCPLLPQTQRGAQKSKASSSNTVSAASKIQFGKKKSNKSLTEARAMAMRYEQMLEQNDISDEEEMHEMQQKQRMHQMRMQNQQKLHEQQMQQESEQESSIIQQQMKRSQSAPRSGNVEESKEIKWRGMHRPIYQAPEISWRGSGSAVQHKSDIDSSSEHSLNTRRSRSMTRASQKLNRSSYAGTTAHEETTATRRNKSFASHASSSYMEDPYQMQQRMSQSRSHGSLMSAAQDEEDTDTEAEAHPDYGSIAKKFQALAVESEASSAHEMARSGRMQSAGEVSVGKRSGISEQHDYLSSEFPEPELDEAAMPPARALAERFETIARERSQAELSQIDHEEALHQQAMRSRKKNFRGKKKFGSANNMRSQSQGHTGLSTSHSFHNFGHSQTGSYMDKQQKQQALHQQMQQEQMEAMQQQELQMQQQQILKKQHSRMQQQQQQIQQQEQQEEDMEPAHQDFSKKKSKVSATLSKTLLEKFQKFNEEADSKDDMDGDHHQMQHSSMGRSAGGRSSQTFKRNTRKPSSPISKSGSLPSFAKAQEPSEKGDQNLALSRILRQAPPAAHIERTRLLNQAISAKSQEAAWAGPAEKTEGEADVANEEEVTSVQQEDEGEEAKTEPRFEETLADYQPPKRYVKEERKETAKAPKVMIMGLNNESTSRSSTSSQSKYGAPLQMSREESENEATEIIRADDLVKDDREDLPSIGNIKSHFEQISDQTQSQDESMITKTSSSTDGVVTTIVKRSGSHNSEGETNRSRSTSQSRVGGSESRSRGNSESESRQAAKQAKIGSKTTVSSSESRIVNKDSKHSTIESHKSGNVEDEQEIYREGTKEVIINPDEIPKEGLVGLRTKYEQEVAGKLSNEDGGPSLSRKASKWDKPKDPAPPPINRKEGDEDTDSVFSEVIAEELPPSAMTRTLVTRFRSFEEGEEQLSIERKGVRRMTPPRDEMHASLAAYRKSVEEKQIVRDPNIIISGTKDEYEKELPPPKFAKSMLTKFKSLELEDAPPPSPLRSEQVATLARQASTTKQTSQAHTSAMTDSGICIEGRGEISMSDPIPSLRHEEVIEGGIFENKPVQSQGVVREADSPNEEELPESGIAKNLLNQWRSVETVETFVPAEYSSTSSGHKPSARYSHECRVGSQAVENGEVIRESDQNEEEFLPPRGLSKNLTAKFKSLEEQNKELGIITPVDYSIHAYRNSSSARYTHECRMGTPTQSMEGLAVIRESDRNEEEFLPPPGMSKSLMTKFKSIEEEYKDVATFPVDFSQTSSSHSSHARISHECRMGSVSGDGELEVVRETDQNEEAFLPPSGLSKNLTAKFMTLEEQNRELAFSSTSSLNKKDLEKQQYKWNVKEVRPLTGTGKVQIIPVEKGQISEEGVENKYTFQVDRDDVQIDAHADNIELHEEELPAPSTAKKLLEKFSSFDESTAPAPTPEQSAVIQREAVKSVRTNSSRHTIVQESTESNGDFFQQEVSVHEQYIGKPESGEFENEPIVNSSVVRESDCYDEEELPEAGLTKTLRARFQE